MNLALVSALLLLAPPRPFAVGFGAKLGSAECGAVNPLTLPITGHTAGNVIVVPYASSSSLGLATAVSDDGGNSYTRINLSTIAGKAVSVWVSAGTNAATSITITRGASGGALACAVDYTGASTNEDSEGVGSGGVGSGSATATWTVVASGTLSFFTLGHIGATNNVDAAPSGWTSRYNLQHTSSSVCLSFGDTASNSPLSPGSNTFTQTWVISDSSWNLLVDSVTQAGTVKKGDLIPMTGGGLR